jgi:hypothetical protein
MNLFIDHHHMRLIGDIPISELQYFAWQWFLKFCHHWIVLEQEQEFDCQKFRFIITKMSNHLVLVWIGSVMAKKVWWNVIEFAGLQKAYKKNQLSYRNFFGNLQQQIILSLWLIDSFKMGAFYPKTTKSDLRTDLFHL